MHCLLADDNKYHQWHIHQAEWNAQQPYTCDLLSYQSGGMLHHKGNPLDLRVTAVLDGDVLRIGNLTFDIDTFFKASEVEMTYSSADGKEAWNTLLYPGTHMERALVAFTLGMTHVYNDSLYARTKGLDVSLHCFEDAPAFVLQHLVLNKKSGAAGHALLGTRMTKFALALRQAWIWRPDSVHHATKMVSSERLLDIMRNNQDLESFEAGQAAGRFLFNAHRWTTFDTPAISAHEELENANVLQHLLHEALSRYSPERLKPNIRKTIFPAGTSS